MTTSLLAELSGFRFVEVRFGDDLQALSARELGDASRWPEIAALNSLSDPYLTGDAALARPGIALAGSLIRVPAPESVAFVSTDPDLVFGVDLLLVGGKLQSVNGDLALVGGRANLHQALVHALDTDTGDLPFYPTYGSRIRSLIGSVSGPVASALAASYARDTAEADSRIDSVTSSDASVVGDVISVTVDAQPIVGRTVDVGLTL